MGRLSKNFENDLVDYVKQSLFLTQVLPFPLDAGPKLRNYYVFRWLSKEYKVTLLSFIRSVDTQSAVEYLSGYCQNVVTIPMRRSRLLDGLAMLRSLVSKDPFLIARDRSTEMRNAIRHTMQDERFDVIHADQLWMAPFALLAKQEAQKQGYTPLLVLDQHNAVFQVPKRMAGEERNPILYAILHREARLMAKYEVETCQKFDRVVWVTEEDRQAVREQSSVVSRQSPKGGDAARSSVKSEERNRVIPICIDPALIEPVELREDTQDILFLGGMHWPPNADGVMWFTREVFPLVKKECPEAKLVVVGKEPPKNLSKIEGVTVSGYVDDPEIYWKNSRVFIVPLKAGGGMRVKILDAWGHGIPVVSTTIGAEGICYKASKEIMIADDPAGLAKAVVSLLRDTGLARQVGSAGRAALEREYDWRKTYQAWEDVYAN